MSEPARPRRRSLSSAHGGSIQAAGSYEALQSMYCSNRDMCKVFEFAHGLDCLRCFDKKKLLKDELAALKADIGDGPFRQLLLTAERLLRATGDRILDFLPSKSNESYTNSTGGLSYQSEAFKESNTDAMECLNKCQGPIEQHGQ